MDTHGFYLPTYFVIDVFFAKRSSGNGDVGGSCNKTGASRELRASFLCHRPVRLILLRRRIYLFYIVNGDRLYINN